MTLVVEGVTVRFDDHRAVDAVDLAVDRGEILALLGPSGCGKSTLLRAIAGLQPIARGSVAWDGRDLDGVPPHDREIGLMFQDDALFPHRDVAANIGFGLRMRGVGGSARRGRVADLLALVGLEGFGSRGVETLSGGEAQRVALARALAPRPRVLLLDEPFASLDRPLRDRLIDDVPRILRSAGVAAIHVTHDHDEAFATADRVAVMSGGRLRRVGSPRAVWSDPRSESVARFLGHPNLFEVGPEGEAPWGTVPLDAGCYVLRTDAVVAGVDESSADVVGTVEATRFQAGRSHVVLHTRPGDHPLTVEIGHHVEPGDRLGLSITWQHVPPIERP